MKGIILIWRIQLRLSGLVYGDGTQYKEYFHNLLYLEELQQEIDLSFYNKSHAKLMRDTQRSEDNEPRFILKVRMSTKFHSYWSS